MRGISKFERRILFAIFLCGVTPFAISSIFIPQIVESRLALSLHPQVQEQLEASAVFFKEFFDAKKREFAARAEAIAADPILVRAATAAEVEDVRVRLAQVLADNEEIRKLRVYRPTGEIMVEALGPEDRHGPDMMPKRISFPLGVGDAPKLELEFILPSHYFEDRAHAEEIAVLYDTSLKGETQRRDAYFRGYILISATVVVLSLGIGYTIARRVTRRIARLASATERVAKGESGFTVPLRGNDEITELSARFNRMIEEVADARDRIIYLEKVSGWQEFARRLAHEIKNPLTPIRLAIQELERRAPEDDPAYRRLVQESAAVVEEEIGTLTRLVDEFSQFARLPEVIPALVDLRSFLEEFLAAYNHFAPDAKVTFSVPESSVDVAIDRALMRRVFANLATNAIQAAGPGRAELHLVASPLPGGALELRVEDNGPGVPPSHAEKIFEPYFTTKGDGTGLGLAIAKKIVLQHGGTIAVRRSNTLGGAAFVITLPNPAGVEREPDERARTVDATSKGAEAF